MPIIIGDALGSDFTNPIGLLTDCHRRIEKFLTVLHTVACQAQGSSLNDEHRRALEVSLRYFRESAPKHTADEEDSLFPRMMTRAGAESNHISDLLGQLNADHRSLTESHDQLDELGLGWLAHNLLPPRETTQMVAMIERLKGTYERHIAIEELEVFPFAGRILPPEDLQLIANEMAARRNLPVKDFAISGIIPR